MNGGGQTGSSDDDRIVVDVIRRILLALHNVVRVKDEFGVTAGGCCIAQESIEYGMVVTREFEDGGDGRVADQEGDSEGHHQIRLGYYNWRRSASDHDASSMRPA